MEYTQSRTAKARRSCHGRVGGDLAGKQAAESGVDAPARPARSALEELEASPGFGIRPEPWPLIFVARCLGLPSCATPGSMGAGADVAGSPLRRFSPPVNAALSSDGDGIGSGSGHLESRVLGVQCMSASDVFELPRPANQGGGSGSVHAQRRDENGGVGRPPARAVIGRPSW